MFYELLVGLTGAASFLFILWRRLKEDYASSIIFTGGFLVLSGLAIAWGVSRIFMPRWWFWLDVLAISLALGFAIFRFKMKTFEVLDAAVSAAFPWLILAFLFDSVRMKNIYSLGGFFVILAIYLLYHFLNASYKRFSWYRSGRVGFSGLAAIAILLSLRSLTSLFFVDMLSFVGRQDAIISGSIAFLAFLGIFHLSRQT